MFSNVRKCTGKPRVFTGPECSSSARRRLKLLRHRAQRPTCSSTSSRVESSTAPSRRYSSNESAASVWHAACPSLTALVPWPPETLSVTLWRCRRIRRRIHDDGRSAHRVRCISHCLLPHGLARDESWEGAEEQVGGGPSGCGIQKCCSGTLQFPLCCNRCPALERVVRARLVGC